MKKQHNSLPYFALLLVFLFSGTATANPLDDHDFQHQSGWVRSGDTAIPYASVRLYKAGEKNSASGSVLLGAALSDAQGFFRIPYEAPVNSNSVLFLVADHVNHGNGYAQIKLAAVLDTKNIPRAVVINERSSVAIAYALAQFTDGLQVGGKFPGLQNAAATAQNLADLSSGGVANILSRPPNGSDTSTEATFNSLANMLASCIHTAANCAALFLAATPPEGAQPHDTLQAILNIAHYPWQNVQALFTIAQTSTLYQPALNLLDEVNLDAWTLALRYQGNGLLGQQLDGPGNIALDRLGNAWVNNNYQFNLDPTVSVCGSNQVFKFTPTGATAPGSPFHGGGLYGAGFGITLDPDGNIWVGNFGFQGEGCPLPFQALSKSVSKFNRYGTALSPITGFTKPDTIDQPQGTISDTKGNIWTANCSSQSITKIPRGNPELMWNVGGLGSKPFGIATDSRGHVWVASNNAATSTEPFPSGLVWEITQEGIIVGDAVNGNDGISRPMGVATDSLGNIWVANSGIIDILCEGTLAEDMLTQDVGDNGELNVNASVTLIEPLAGGHRKVTTFGKETDQRGGLALPWGIAVDGNDNVWVANFDSQQVTQLCGARPENCPPGKTTGDPISPDTGYGSDALVRNTGVQIDPSGNVWLANNWILSAPDNLTNPGGHEVVVFIGLAGPLKTPLIGAPQQP